MFDQTPKLIKHQTSNGVWDGFSNVCKILDFSRLFNSFCLIFPVGIFLLLILEVLIMKIVQKSETHENWCLVSEIYAHSGVSTLGGKSLLKTQMLPKIGIWYLKFMLLPVMVFPLWKRSIHSLTSSVVL